MGTASSRHRQCASTLCSPHSSQRKRRGSGDERRMLLPQVSPHSVTVGRNSEAYSAIVMLDDRGSSVLPIRPTTSLVSFCQDSRGWFRIADLSRRATTRCKKPKEDQPLFRRRARGPPSLLFLHLPLVEGDGAPSQRSGRTRSYLSVAGFSRGRPWVRVALLPARRLPLPVPALKTPHENAPRQWIGMAKLIGRRYFTVKNNFTHGEYGENEDLSTAARPKETRRRNGSPFPRRLSGAKLTLFACPKLF